MLPSNKEPLPAFNASDVSDILEPAAKGLTPSAQPQKERAFNQKEEEILEIKKQRQKRQAQEQERKKLEEKTRRAARKARGAPAKNGIPVSKPPANNVWTGLSGSRQPLLLSMAMPMNLFWTLLHFALLLGQRSMMFDLYLRLPCRIKLLISDCHPQTHPNARRDDCTFPYRNNNSP